MFTRREFIQLVGIGMTGQLLKPIPIPQLRDDIAIIGLPTALSFGLIAKPSTILAQQRLQRNG